jgi:hypothetical protein
MTNLHVHSNSSDQTPVADVKERLAQILETVLQLQGNSEWFQAEAADLFSELRGVAQEPTAPDIAAALDAVAWVDSAASNIEGEFFTLVSCLEDVLEG